jgi:hypothetical protein
MALYQQWTETMERDAIILEQVSRDQTESLSSIEHIRADWRDSGNFPVLTSSESHGEGDQRQRSLPTSNKSSPSEPDPDAKTSFPRFRMSMTHPKLKSIKKGFMNSALTFIVSIPLVVIFYTDCPPYVIQRPLFCSVFATQKQPAVSIFIPYDIANLSFNFAAGESIGMPDERRPLPSPTPIEMEINPQGLMKVFQPCQEDSTDGSIQTSQDPVASLSLTRPVNPGKHGRYQEVDKEERMVAGGRHSTPDFGSAGKVNPYAPGPSSVGVHPPPARKETALYPSISYGPPRQITPHSNSHGETRWPMTTIEGANRPPLNTLSKDAAYMYYPRDISPAPPPDAPWERHPSTTGLTSPPPPPITFPYHDMEPSTTNGFGSAIDTPGDASAVKGKHSGDPDDFKKLRSICTDENLSRLYHNSKRISRGNMYSAYQIKTNRLVAIKHMDLENEPRRNVVINEILLMRGLIHCNIIRYVDSLLYQNHVWIITEYMEGGSLRDIVPYQRMSEGQISAVSREIAQGE